MAGDSRKNRGSDATYRRFGDFRVTESALESARETFEQRSERSQAVDKALRGPIVTDPERYAEAQGRVFDFPGVDTPTDEPRQGVTDLPFPEGRPGRGGTGDVRVVPDSRSMAEDVAADREQVSAQGSALASALPEWLR